MMFSMREKLAEDLLREIHQPKYQSDDIHARTLEVLKQLLEEIRMIRTEQNRGA